MTLTRLFCSIRIDHEDRSKVNAKGVMTMKMSLRAARMNAGLSIKEAAKQLGVDEKALGRYELGRVYPNIRIVCKLLDLYGVQFDDIDFRIREEQVG